MAIVFTKHGDNILEIDDSTQTESVMLNFDEITMKSSGDFAIFTQKGVIHNGSDVIKIDYNDVTTPAGTTSGENLCDTIAELF